MPRAVMLSNEKLESSSRARSEILEALSIKLEGLLERMQTPAARKGMEAAFHTSLETLGQSAAMGAE